MTIEHMPQRLDILDKLNEETDILRDGNSGASDDELADLFGEAAEEIKRLRKEIAEALYRNQEADTEIVRLREQLGRAELSYRQCDSDRREFAEENRLLRQERDGARLQLQRAQPAIIEEWKAKYDALAAGIEDKRLIENAETLARSAAQLSATTAQPFEEVFYAMMEAIRLQRGRGTANFMNPALLRK